MTADLVVDKKAVERAMRIAPKELKEELGDAFDHIGRSFLSTFRKQRFMGPPGVYGSGQRGLFGTFVLASLVPQSLEGMGMTISSQSSIATRHEHGGTTTAKSGNLAVPMKSNPTAFAMMYTQGAMKRLKKQYKDLSKVKGTFTINKNGKTYICKRIAGKVVVMYVLKKSVHEDPRLEFYELFFSQSQNDKRVQILNSAVSRAIARV